MVLPIFNNITHFTDFATDSDFTEIWIKPFSTTKNIQLDHWSKNPKELNIKV